MEDGRIKDYQLRASSFLNNQSQAANSRLNHLDGLGGWYPNQTANGSRTEIFYSEIIQVRLNMPVRIKGIATQGRYNGEERVERYGIRYTTDIKNRRFKTITDEQTKYFKVRMKFQQVQITSERNKQK